MSLKQPITSLMRLANIPRSYSGMNARCIVLREANLVTGYSSLPLCWQKRQIIGTYKRAQRKGVVTPKWCLKPIALANVGVKHKRLRQTYAESLQRCGGCPNRPVARRDIKWASFKRDAMALKVGRAARRCNSAYRVKILRRQLKRGATPRPPVKERRI